MDLFPVDKYFTVRNIQKKLNRHVSSLGTTWYVTRTITEHTD